MYRLIILTLIFVQLSFQPNTDAFFHCKRLVKQFYECKNLKMKAVDNQTFERLSIKYQPDSSISENLLNDSFYQENLGNLSLSQTFDLFWTIYESGHNCTSDFCKCASFDHIDSLGKYSKWFRNRGTFDQVKKTIVEMYEKNPDEQSDLSDLSALDAFCEKYDLFPFGSFITSKKIISCAEFDENSLESAFHDCVVPRAENANLAWLLDHTSSQFELVNALETNQQEQIGVCVMKLVDFLSCSNEIQRFTVLALTFDFLEKRWLTIENLTSYQDSFLNQVINYKGPLSFKSASLSIPTDSSHSKPIISYLRDEQPQITCNSVSSAVLTIFGSAQFNLTAEAVIHNGHIDRFKSFKLTALYEKNTYFTHTFDFAEKSKLIKDCSIRDPERPYDRAWIRVISDSRSSNPFYKIYDFKWNSYYKLTDASLSVFAPSSIFNEATGILIKGC